jgi:hypothetical protein
MLNFASFLKKGLYPWKILHLEKYYPEFEQYSFVRIWARFVQSVLFRMAKRVFFAKQNMEQVSFFS